MDGFLSSLRNFLRRNRSRSRSNSRGFFYGGPDPLYFELPKPSTHVFYKDFDGPISIKKFDLRIPENTYEHYTEQFALVRREDNSRLVVRRGQGFRIKLVFSRYYDINRDAISFIFEFAGAERPSYGQRSLVAVALLPKGEFSTSTWSAELESWNNNFMTILITPAADCLIGEWKMDIDTRLINGAATSFSCPSSIFILFNPWCKEDSVYLEDENQRTEYVLADTGLIWKGTTNRLKPSVWKYAQFEKYILECSLYLITKVAKLGVSDLGDPIKISRALSAVINDVDDNGVLMGNWSGNFSGGKAPGNWLGSMEILKQYWKYRKPVKFAQCWVFGGVLTTVARALGLPCRVVTNFSSAHDVHNSMTVDIIVDETGRVINSENNDIIWNYHVWNEVWMRRPDLSETGEFDGWQAVDCTPQEKSDGIYRCGPASIACVKRGQIKRPYDTAFVYSEVNADKLYWKYNGPSMPLKLLGKNTEQIGEYICTKAVGKWEGEDITHNYKFPEDSKEERDVMLRVLKQSESMFSRYYLNEDFNDIKFTFEFRDDIVIGSPFSVILVVQNKNKEKDYRVNAILQVYCVNYMGKVGENVKEDKFDLSIEAGTVEELKLTVTYDEYYKRLCDQCSFKISCLGNVLDTNFEYFSQKLFRVRKPDIKFQLIEGRKIMGQELKVKAFFVNPLPIPLKKGKFIIEGGGLTKQLKIKLSENVYPSEEAKVEFKVTPRTDGDHTIVAKFKSNELDDVDGFFNIKIAPDIERNSH